jgi:hypothetical protein
LQGKGFAGRKILMILAGLTGLQESGRICLCPFCPWAWSSWVGRVTPVRAVVARMDRLDLIASPKISKKCENAFNLALVSGAFDQAGLPPLHLLARQPTILDDDNRGLLRRRNVVTRLKIKFNCAKLAAHDPLLPLAQRIPIAHSPDPRRSPKNAQGHRPGETQPVPGSISIYYPTVAQFGAVALILKWLRHFGRQIGAVLMYDPANAEIEKFG